MKPRKCGWIVVVALLILGCGGASGPMELHLRVASTVYQATNVPVHVAVNLPGTWSRVAPEEIAVVLHPTDHPEMNVPGQIVQNDNDQTELWWVLPEEAADAPTEWTATIRRGAPDPDMTFHWTDTPGKHLDLTFGDRKILRYEYEINENYPRGENLTALNKAFYHIFDLAGEHLITNGPEEGLWSHHRGIMIGWRDVGFQGQELSFWGMEDRTFQKHIRFLAQVAGPVLARTTALIHWDDSTGTTILEEKRTATVYRQPAPTIALLDFASSLTAVNGPVHLDGNAEHGGVQYRAHNDVADEAPGAEKPTYYFHQDGIDPHTDYDLPWVGMMYGLNGKHYSVLDMDNPANPDSTIWSAYRDYGRFGPFFRTDLAADQTLTIHYRFWIAESDMPARQVLSGMDQAYVNSPSVQITN